MNSYHFEDYLDLSRADIEPEVFAAALAVQHVRRLIANGGNDTRHFDLDSALQPQHLELFLARAVETSRRTKHFEHEWRRLQQLFPRPRDAWEKGHLLFQEDLAGAIDRPEKMEALSTIDVVDCSASVGATHLYPYDRTLQNWAINGYMLAWRQHFLAEDAPSQEEGTDDYPE